MDFDNFIAVHLYRIGMVTLRAPLIDLSNIAAWIVGDGVEENDEFELYTKRESEWI